MKINQKIFGIVAVTTFSVIGASCVLTLIAGIPGFAANLPVWLSAIGTIGAFAAAIYLARTETRERNRRDLARARLRAAGMKARVMKASSVVGDLRRELADVVKVDRSENEIISLGRDLLELKLWTLDEVEHLIPLPNDIAVMMAQSASEIQRIVDTFQRLTYDKVLHDMIHRRRFAHFHESILADIHDELSKCIIECVRAHQHISRPELDHIIRWN